MVLFTKLLTIYNGLTGKREILSMVLFTKLLTNKRNIKESSGF